MNSRRSFLLGAGVGAAGLYLGNKVWRGLFNVPGTPPWAVEHATDSFWLADSGFYNFPPLPPLNARSHKTDILIVGGGFTGMSTAWHLLQTRPEARVTLIDAAKCGFGASGRNGGWCMGANYAIDRNDTELMQGARDFMRAGVGIVQAFQEEHGLDCDFTPAKQISAVRFSGDVEALAEFAEPYDAIGVKTAPLGAQQMQARYHTDHFKAGMFFHDGSANIQPGKLGLGLRNLLRTTKVEIFEGTKVIGIDKSGAKPKVETEFGIIEADELVLATNAYGQSYGEFKNRYVPVVTNVIATAPLTQQQLADTGWRHGEQWSINDSGDGYFYGILTADNRILIGGGHVVHHYGNGLHRGNQKSETNFLEDALTTQMWPQLKGLRIDHRWGGNICATLDAAPSVGTQAAHPHIHYALGYTGEGVSTSFAAGKCLAELLGGMDTPLTRSIYVNRPLPFVPGEPFISPGLRLLSPA